MILIINICEEPLHFFEFVKPVADIVQTSGRQALIVHYKDLSEDDLKKADKVIICGTSLKDNEFLEGNDNFKWIKDYKKPLLGICGGAHLVGFSLGKKLKQKKEIGLKPTTLKKRFLGQKGKKEVFHLHQFYTLPEIFNQDNLYATLFHPEVRNKEMIETFLKL